MDGGWIGWDNDLLNFCCPKRGRIHTIPYLIRTRRGWTSPHIPGNTETNMKITADSTLIPTASNVDLFSLLFLTGCVTYVSHIPVIFIHNMTA
jgi:hypothetical protein